MHFFGVLEILSVSMFVPTDLIGTWPYHNMYLFMKTDQNLISYNEIQN